MAKLKVTQFQPAGCFERDLKRAPADVQADAQVALNELLANSAAGALRLHSLKGYPKPTIFKIDLRADHSWQITFEVDGETAVLLRLGTHRQLDRRPR